MSGKDLHKAVAHALSTMKQDQTTEGQIPEPYFGSAWVINNRSNSNSTKPLLCSAFPVISGFRVKFDHSGEKHTRLIDACLLDGTKLSEVPYCRVVTNSFLAKGGAGFEQFKNAEHAPLDYDYLPMYQVLLGHVGKPVSWLLAILLYSDLRCSTELHLALEGLRAYADEAADAAEKSSRREKVDRVLEIQKSRAAESKSVKVGIKEAKKAMRKIFGSELGRLLPTLPIGPTGDGRLTDVALQQGW
jgi:hypothetical protein